MGVEVSQHLSGVLGTFLDQDQSRSVGYEGGSCGVSNYSLPQGVVGSFPQHACSPVNHCAPKVGDVMPSTLVTLYFWLTQRRDSIPGV